MSAAPGNTTQQKILHKRIAFALRRFTGVAYDVDAMLAQPDMRAQRVALWREAGCSELNELLDQLDCGAGRKRTGEAGATGQPGVTAR